MRLTANQMALEAIINGQSVQPILDAVAEMNGDNCPECNSTNVMESDDQFQCEDCGHLWWQPEHDPERDWDEDGYHGDDYNPAVGPLDKEEGF